jgi:hypothetical protein
LLVTTAIMRFVAIAPPFGRSLSPGVKDGYWKTRSTM